MPEQQNQPRRFESRADGRHINSLDFVHHLYKNSKPRLAYNLQFNHDEMLRWRYNVRSKLQELMALPSPSQQPDPLLLIEKQRDGYTLQKWEIYPEEGCAVRVLVLIPGSASTQHPAPAVLCMPGSNHTKECLAGEDELPGVVFHNRNPEQNRMAYHYAKRGIVAVAIDHPMIGEAGLGDCDTSRQDICWHLAWLGRSYESLSVSQKLSVLHWVKTLEYVDRHRIATSGHSLGAKPALILGLLDADIKAVVWNDFVNDWRERQIKMGMHHPGWWHMVPGMAQWFDYADLIAALAPTPLLIAEGGQTSVIERIRTAYEKFDAAQQLSVTYYPEYAHPTQRQYDQKVIPEGIDAETYFKYVNVNPDKHWFKADVAVSWLSKTLKIT